jgi:hypothetical protein
MLEIQKSLTAYMKKYPKSKLVDVYKFYYQDLFGPAHFIHNKNDAFSYLLKELQVPMNPVSYVEPLGYMQNYYRVHLNLLQDGLFDASSFFEIFLKSAAITPTYNPQQCSELWYEVLCCIEKSYAYLIEPEQQNIISEAIINDGSLHHSSIYSESYKPHYRIIHKRFIPEFKTKKKLNIIMK